MVHESRDSFLLQYSRLSSLLLAISPSQRRGKPSLTNLIVLFIAVDWGYVLLEFVIADWLRQVRIQVVEIYKAASHNGHASSAGSARHGTTTSEASMLVGPRNKVAVSRPVVLLDVFDDVIFLLLSADSLSLICFSSLNRLPGYGHVLRPGHLLTREHSLLGLVLRSLAGAHFLFQS